MALFSGFLETAASAHRNSTRACQRSPLHAANSAGHSIASTIFYFLHVQPGESRLYPHDAGAEGIEPAVNVGIAAINLLDILDDAFAFG